MSTTVNDIDQQHDVFSLAPYAAPLSFRSLTEEELPRPAMALLHRVEERIYRLMQLFMATEISTKEKAALNLLLEHIIKLLELPVSVACITDLNKKIERVLNENRFRTMHRAAFNDLTQREREVLMLLATGCSNQEAADKLYISLETIKHYRKTIKSKLSVTSTANLIEYAQAFNLV